MTVYRQSFLVEGTGTFPYDMLRYDECFPEFEGESPLLDSNELLHSADFFNKPRQVRVKRYIFDKKELPTTERWRSFGWKVITDSIHVTKVN